MHRHRDEHSNTTISQATDLYISNYPFEKKRPYVSANLVAYKP
jgi:hypothetical protein